MVDGRCVRSTSGRPAAERSSTTVAAGRGTDATAGVGSGSTSIRSGSMAASYGDADAERLATTRRSLTGVAGDGLVRDGLA
jgi:hypothetical protein